MIRNVSVAVLLVLLSALCLTPAWAQNLVVNGGFETGTFSGWESGFYISDPGPDWSLCADPSNPTDCFSVIQSDTRGDQGNVSPHSGSWCARIHAYTDPSDLPDWPDSYIGGMSQVVTGLNPALSYWVTVWMRTRPDYTPSGNMWWGRLRYDPTGSPLPTGSTVVLAEKFLGSGWTKYEATISGTSTVSIFAEVEVMFVMDNGANVYIDDVSVTPALPRLVVSNVTCHVTGSTTATIEWDTKDEQGAPVAATSRVLYGLSPSLGMVAEDLNLVTHHMVNLTGLQNHEVYYYQCESTNPNYLSGTSDVGVFPSSGPRLGNPDFQEGWHEPGRITNRWAWYRTVEGSNWWEDSADNSPDTGQSTPTGDNPNDDMSQRLQLSTNGGLAPGHVGIYQVMDTVAGTTYVLHGWGRNLYVSADVNTAEPVPSRLVVKWAFDGAVSPDVPVSQQYIALTEGDVNNPIIPEDGGRWLPFACSFTATGPTTTIFLEAQMDGGAPGADQYWVAVDDLAVGPRVDWSQPFARGWNLLGLSYEPLIVRDDDTLGTAVQRVFAGLNVDNLVRFDTATVGYIQYDPYDPKTFGPPLSTSGMWFLGQDAGDLSYQGVDNTFPVRITLTPVQGGGWTMIASALPYRVALADLYVFNPNVSPGSDPAHPADYLTLADAVAAGWINSLVYGWDPSLIRYLEVGLDGPPINDANWLEPGFGYWVNTRTPNCILVIPPKPMP